MKKLLFLFLFSQVASHAFSQELFSYGNHPVSSSEFLRAYNKNKTAKTDDQQALRDYLDLYINFKLKVQAARDAHLDTLPNLKADLQNFRSQIEDNYLKDEKQLNALVDEAFVRSQKDIHVLYFFIPANDQMSFADTAKFFKGANELSQQLKSNKGNTDEILQKLNTAGVPVTKNDLGFITVFTLPYEYENIIYGLKPGQTSTPYRTKKGWHIFKNIEERRAVGKVKLAQILFAVPEGFNEQRAHTKKLADSVYDALKNGADFGALAKQYSDDKMTYMNGGEMPEFGVAKYNPDFEKMAFSIKNDHEIAKPFETEFGFHIIKRISATPVLDNKNDEAFMFNLKQEVLKDSRIEVAKKKFLADILPKIGYRKLPVNEQDLWKVSDSSLLVNKNVSAGKVNENTVLFSYNDNGKVKVSDWIQYLRNSNKAQPGALHESYQKLFPDFIALSATNNYRKRLSAFNPEFKNQLEEFKDGNMLFEIMERQVWEKASTDSVGLLNYYDAHKDKYWWNASADAIIFSCANETVAKNSIHELEKGTSWKQMVVDNSSQVQADSGRYELSQIPANSATKFTAGLITKPVVNANDGTAVFSKILNLFPDHQPRNFNDARGLVINDYQNFLEEKWIVELKKEYPVKVNDKVFQSLLKQRR